MNNLSDIYKQLDTLTNKGKSVTSRTYEKSFGLFKNPVFLITFFAIVIGTGAYYLYHYFKKQGESECHNFSNEKDCSDNCLWDSQEEVCQSVDRVGNVCPDYFNVKKSSDKKTIICVDSKQVLSQGQDKNTVNNCYTTPASRELELSSDGKPISKYNSKCEWIRNCGTWGTQVSWRNCSPANDKLKTYFKNT